MFRCLPHGTLDGLSPEPVETSAVATISRHVQPTARHSAIRDALS